MKKNSVFIDEACCNSLNSYAKQHANEDLPGTNEDCSLFLKDRWLQDSVVLDRITQSKGQWHIFLVFVCSESACKLIKRKITICTTLAKAQLAAHYMRRQASRDPRGNFSIPKDKFQYCFN